jgi:hypothetical protein
MPAKVEEEFIPFFELLGGIIQLIYDVETGCVFIQKQFDIILWYLLGFEELGKSHSITVSKLQGRDFFVLGDADEQGVLGLCLCGECYED